jgi:hypothetical protein
MDKELEELEARVIERAKFWDGYIDMLIRLRDGCQNSAEKTHAGKVIQVENMLRDGLQQAIDAALRLQRAELAVCFTLASAGSKRAEEYARERAEEILGKDAVKFRWECSSEHKDGVAIYTVGMSEYTLRFARIHSAILVRAALFDAYRLGYENGVRRAECAVQQALSKLTQ